MAINAAPLAKVAVAVPILPFFAQVS